MKKIIALILCLQMFGLPAFADGVIEDALVSKTLANKNLKIKTSKENPVVDNFADSTLVNKPLIIKIQIQPIQDDFARKTINNKTFVQHPVTVNNENNIQDELVNITLKSKKFVVNKNSSLGYDYTSIKQIPVKISIEKDITSKKGLKEGQYLNFKVLNDVKINNNTTIKKGSIVQAELETISPNQAYGVPANLVIDKFTLKEQPQISFDGAINKAGANRSLWVYPIGYSSLLFFGVGILVFAIRGGHAKINAKDTFVVYYIPQ